MIVEFSCVALLRLTSLPATKTCGTMDSSLIAAIRTGDELSGRGGLGGSIGTILPPAVTRWCFGEVCFFRNWANPASSVENTGSVDFLLVRGGWSLEAFDAEFLFGRDDLIDSLFGRFLGFSERIGFLLRSGCARLPTSIVNTVILVGLYRVDGPETHDSSS